MRSESCRHFAREDDIWKALKAHQEKLLIDPNIIQNSLVKSNARESRRSAPARGNQNRRELKTN
jgi:hypothetical protein